MPTQTTRAFPTTLVRPPTSRSSQNGLGVADQSRSVPQGAGKLLLVHFGTALDVPAFRFFVQLVVRRAGRTLVRALAATATGRHVLARKTARRLRLAVARPLLVDRPRPALLGALLRLPAVEVAPLPVLVLAFSL